MIPRVNLARLMTPSTPREKEDNRQKTLDRIQSFNDAQAEIERVCDEKGIPVPPMVC